MTTALRMKSGAHALKCVAEAVLLGDALLANWDAAWGLQLRHCQHCGAPRHFYQKSHGPCHCHGVHPSSHHGNHASGHGVSERSLTTTQNGNETTSTWAYASEI